LGLLIDNRTDKQISFQLQGQILTTSARELIPIAGSPKTDVEFLKTVAEQVRSGLEGSYGDDFAAGLLAIHVVTTTLLDDKTVNCSIVFTAPKK
jgi:hypothetical protein